MSSGIFNDHTLDFGLCRTLKIYGASDKRDQLEPLLIWATPRQRGFPSRTGSTSYESSVHAGSSAHARPSRSSGAAKGMTVAQKEAARKQQEALQKAAELKQMLNGLERVDDEGRRSSLLEYAFQG
jgi:SWI/SNF-related matrix-associated actin-dependent regulator of chromatin subfamily A3